MRELTSQFNYRDNRWRIRSLFKITRNNYARCIIDSTTFRFEPEIEQSQQQSGEFDYSRMDEKETISSQKKKKVSRTFWNITPSFPFIFFFSTILQRKNHSQRYILASIEESHEIIHEVVNHLSFSPFSFRRFFSYLKKIRVHKFYHP